MPWRWRDHQAGSIYEWDSQHGTVEAYDDRGRHLGEFDPLSAERLKNPIGVAEWDDGLGAYPLNRDQVSVISRLLETPIDNENLDYFLEVYDQGADRNAPGE